MLQVDTSQLSLYLENAGVPDFVISLLSKPQVLLAFMYKTGNAVQALLAQQNLVLNDLLNSLTYVRNTEKTLNTNLTEAKIVLSRFDSSGKIQVDKYKEKIMAFLKDANVKSGSSDQFGKTNIDSQEDIFVGVQAFLSIQQALSLLITNLASVKEDIATLTVVNTITKNLSTFNITRLTQLDESKNDVSKVGLAIDLFSSVTVFDYLASVANFNEAIFQPLVSKTIPVNMSILAKSEDLVATSLSNPYPQTISHNDFRVAIDGTPITVDFPSTNAMGRAYVLASQGSASYNIPVNTRLYVKVTCPILPAAITLTPEGFQVPSGYIPIDIPSGTQTFSSIIGSITSGLFVNDTGMIPTQFATCDHFSTGVTDRIMIYGKSDVTSIEIVSAPGDYNHLTGLYTQARASCHDSLFLSLGKSNPVNQPSFLDLRDCLNLEFPVSLENNCLRITSGSVGVGSSVEFQTSIATDIGFTDNEPEPTKFNLISNGVALNPLDLGLYNGCLLNNTPITISGNDIIYAGPNGTFEVSIFTDLIKMLPIIQKLKTYKPPVDFERVWTPILSNPTNGQIETARVYTSSLKASIEAFSSGLLFKAENSSILEQANQLLNVLESRGLTLLETNLNQSRFSDFFNNALTTDKSSYGLQLMSTIEKGVKNE